MRNRIDPLIADRAPWLFRDSPAAWIARSALSRLLGYDQVIEVAQELAQMQSTELLQTIALRLAKEVSFTGISNIPRHGAAFVVANHPTGIADGIILDWVIRKIRQDHYFFANHDILHVFPQLSDVIVPVEWRMDRRSHAKTRNTMDFTRRAVREGRLGVIFPSGRLAKRRGLRLQERPWMGSAAMLARKFDLPVIPIHITARNSSLYYIFDALSPSLRDITLFHETLNKDKQGFRVKIGEAISPATLPTSSDEAIHYLRKVTLALGEHQHQRPGK